MIRKILIPSDGSALAERAVERGIELAKATGASVLGLVVTEPFPTKMYGELMLSGVESLQHYFDQEREVAQRTLSPIEAAAKAAGVSFNGYSIPSDSPANTIVATAEQEGCDLICMASEDHSNLLGVHMARKTTWIVTHARVPVLLCH